MVKTTKMIAEDIGLFTCRFNPAYSTRCGEPTSNENHICPKHSAKCSVCGELATGECSYCGQFVCGAPLCDNCESWTDTTRNSGSWGFLNHSHRRKVVAPPIDKMVEKDIS